MKKRIVILLYIWLFSLCIARTQRYRDSFDIENKTNRNIQIMYSYSSLLSPSIIGDVQYGYTLNLGEKNISIGTGAANIQDGIIKRGGYSYFTTYAYDYTKFYKMDWFSKFLLISGELTITDEDGNILMTLDTITREDFEVTEENGITTATLIIRDKEPLE